MKHKIFTDIGQLVTNSGVVKKDGVNIEHKDLGIINNAALVTDESNTVVWFGSKSEIPSKFKKTSKTERLEGRLLTPALVDCHTHTVFGGNRFNELELRLEGKTYQDIAKMGGGIRKTVFATRADSAESLFSTAENYLQLMLKQGVGLIEMKSGYGLSIDAEIKQLQVIRKLAKKYASKVKIESTFLGAHSFPPEATTDSEREKYVNVLCNKMLPQVAQKKLATSCDVFFDEGYYTKDQTLKILTKAKSLGLSIKLHADELADTGGAALAAQIGAMSADHLLRASSEGLKKMAKAKVVAVLLPTTALYLAIPYASVSKMRDAGVCMALATDFNPGSSPCLNLIFVMNLACLAMGMKPSEAFAAATYGGARALRLEDSYGHITVGKRAKLAAFNATSVDELVASIAHPNPCYKMY